MRANSRTLARDIARERIEILFDLAKGCAVSNPELSRRYVKHLREISAHSRIGMPKRMRESICRKCGLVLIPGATARVRIASSKRHVMYECVGCGEAARIHY